MASQLLPFHNVVRRAIEARKGRLLGFHENLAAIRSFTNELSTDGFATEGDTDWTEAAVGAMQVNRHSLLVDVVNCYAANDFRPLGWVPGEGLSVAHRDRGLPMAHSSIAAIALQVQSMPPVRGGHMLIIAATCGYRTGHIFVRNCEGDTYFLASEDSYSLVGLLPGSTSHMVESMSLCHSGGRCVHMDKGIYKMIANIKYYLVPICHPLHRNMQCLDWHSLLMLYSAALTILSLARGIVSGEFTFNSEQGLLLKVIVEGGIVTRVISDRRCKLLGELSSIVTLQGGVSKRTQRLVCAIGETRNVMAVKIALVVMQVAEEAACTGGSVTRAAIDHSRIISEYIHACSKESVEQAINLLAGDEYDDNVAVDGFEATVFGEKFDLWKTTSCENAQTNCRRIEDEDSD